MGYWAMREVVVDFFVVMDEMVMGQGVFGVFSTIDKARVYVEEFAPRTNFRCAVRRLSLIGEEGDSAAVCVAYTHDCIHDVFLLDGLYSDSLLAYDAVGEKGLIVRFVVDRPEEKQTLRPYE